KELLEIFSEDNVEIGEQIFLLLRVLKGNPEFIDEIRKLLKKFMVEKTVNDFLDEDDKVIKKKNKK
ncbi:MAG: hypothetical protein P4L45_00790, partial [Ignavibacteriaceae bacterium]|nr:hypothetical protein [Ignavibacteriaceae bacterium]